MAAGRACNESFPGGITNGAHWYQLSGKYLNEMIEKCIWFYLHILFHVHSSSYVIPWLKFFLP